MYLPYAQQNSTDAAAASDNPCPNLPVNGCNQLKFA